uniref:Synaptopodin 2-like a n=1 Tax=Mastacembelus armatus TaxID=205130 RepID=A0A7N8XEY4_9TELE
MPQKTPPPVYKRKKPSKIITDLSHITQNEYESELEASEFDLGKKIRTPKDIMLEELSLLKNRGSKMFKMRKQRVEKFIYENNPDVFTSDSMDNLQKFVPSVGGHMGGAGGAPVPPPKPGSKVVVGVGEAGGAGSAGSAGGHGGGELGKGGKGEGTSESPLKDASKKKTHVITYVSPWEKAMKGDENLIATLKTAMPGPLERKELLPKYKCFNRTAIPYGGFEKANQLLKFQLPDTKKTKQELESPVVYHHDINCRPSFNRTPIGWVGSSEPSSIHMENDAVPFDGETDEL